MAKEDVAASAGKSETHVRMNSGYLMPLFGWGTAECAGDVVDGTKSAINLGYRHIDTAEMYGNEADIGKGLQEVFKAGTIQREDVFVTSKLGNNHHAPDKARQALKDTLSRLQLEYLDLYLIHWPVSEKAGDRVEPSFQETWQALEQLVKQGLVKSIGLSNFSPQKIESFLSDVKIRPAVNQVEMHAYWRNDRVLKWCSEQGIHVTSYAPMSSPQMADSMDKGHLNLLETEKVKKIAEKLSRSITQVLLRWGLQHGSSVIPKASSSDHQQENLGALGWELSQEDYTTLSSLRQERIFGGSLAINEKGPWRNYEELWDEPEVADVSAAS